MLVEFHLTRGYSSELDLFIAQTVLQYLCLKKSIAASTAFLVSFVSTNSSVITKHCQAYTTEHPRIGSGPPYPNPLLNFIWFLLLSIQVHSSLFNVSDGDCFYIFRPVRASRSTQYFVRNTSLQLRGTLSIWSIWTRLARYLICCLTKIYFFSISLECQPQ